MKEDTRECPYCAEVIRAKAKMCRFCGMWLEPSTQYEVVRLAALGAVQPHLSNETASRSRGQQNIALMARGSPSMREIDLSGRNCFGFDLSMADLQGANLQGTNLTTANLYAANLANADLRTASLHKANLRGANLRNANLVRANLDQADLREADLTGANLGNADLRSAKLQLADLSYANLRATDLRGAQYDVHTRWPGGLFHKFDPDSAGCRRAR